MQNLQYIQVNFDNNVDLDEDEEKRMFLVINCVSQQFLLSKSKRCLCHTVS